MSGRDLGVSVRQRLLNHARSERRPFQELLQYFAMERFLYRLAKSPHGDRFTLKGALLLTAWKAPVARPTMDIDLAARASNELEHIRGLMEEVCQTAVEPDGLEFIATSVEVQRIKQDAEYAGVRVRLNATLANARVRLQIDIGFGDVIVPGPIEIEYPTILEFPSPVIMAYPRETVVAEKLHAVTVLGLLNSRLKDYYDIALLSRLYPFDGKLLSEAIHSTFLHRGPTVEALPVGLTESFASDPARDVQWRAFLRRSRLDSESALVEVVEEVRQFTLPPLAVVATKDTFYLTWTPGGRWE